MSPAVSRIGGLAVALGIATAAAGACAASASAAPSDNRPGTTREDSTGHGPRSASRRAERSTTRAQSNRGTRIVRPATRVSPLPAATAPAVTEPPGTRAAGLPAAAQGIAQPAQPRLGDPRGRLVTIYKGTHFAIPNRWALWVKEVSGDATFIPDSAYDLKDSDQYDWNKLAGITFTPWRPERNASMVVWRYNLQSEQFEVGPFWDVNFAYVFPTDDEIISVPVGQTFSYAVDYDGITVTYGDKTVFKPTPQQLSPNFWTSARITGWFGGSEVAPRTVSYYLHMR
ncbi:MAG: hypothetical protein KIH64_009315 [Mycobacterium sp.]|nr:hypothetical protein [Mycobacterium sp.]